MPFIFERGDGRYKHRWSKDEAGFIALGDESVGKCHSSITESLAQEMLNYAVVYNAPGVDAVEHLYTTYRGVIYEAAPTRPGLSFHGYPWRVGQGRPSLPPRIIRLLRQQADSQGFIQEFEQWLKQHSQ